MKSKEIGCDASSFNINVALDDQGVWVAQQLILKASLTCNTCHAELCRTGGAVPSSGDHQSLWSCRQEYV